MLVYWGREICGRKNHYIHVTGWTTMKSNCINKCIQKLLLGTCKTCHRGSEEPQVNISTLG